MSMDTKTVILLTMTAVLSLSGCQWFQKKDTSPYGEVTPAVESQKAKLLKKIERKYENPAAHYQLGKLYHDDGLLDKAEFEYRVTMGFDPVHYKAQAAIVKVLLDKNDTARSKMSADIYMNQAAVSAEASLLLGKAFQKEQLDEYALACYRQAQSLAPNSAVIFKQIGYYYLAKGDKVRAEENLRHSFQLDPYQSEVAGELGRMGVMVQIPRKPAKSDNFLEKLLKKEESEESQ